MITFIENGLKYVYQIEALLIKEKTFNQKLIYFNKHVSKIYLQNKVKNNTYTKLSFFVKQQYIRKQLKLRKAKNKV